MTKSACPLQEHNIYWEPAEEADGDPAPYGPLTAQIVDLSRGGVIAYCHRTNAHWIVMAMRSIEEPDCTCSIKDTK